MNTENPDKILLPYLTANVHFVTRKEADALLVPNAALRWSPSALSQVSPEALSQHPVDPAAGESAGDAKSAKLNRVSQERKVTLWVKDGEFVRPLEVKVGTSDGVNAAVAAEGL